MSWFSSAQPPSSPEVPRAADEAVRVSARFLIGLQQIARALPLSSGAIRSLGHGPYASPFKGRGMEFDESRPYQAGDDIRGFDWRVTARTGKPHTKLFREERERPVLIWVDYRRPMFFATRGAFKSVIAARAAAILAWSAVQQGDRVGGLVFSEGAHRELRPRQGKSAALGLIRLLAEHPAWDDSNQDPGAVQPPWTFSRLRAVARPGSRIFLISDFRHLAPEGRANLQHLARHSDIVMLQVHDPLETRLPAAGTYRLSNGRQHVTVQTGDMRTAQAYQQRFLDQQTDLHDFCRRHGLVFLPCSTADDLATTLRHGLNRMRQ